MQNDGTEKLRIAPQYTKDQFVRKVLIHLAQEDVPDDVFKEDFGTVTEGQFEIVDERRRMRVNYSAGIGYDRQEPYIDYEDYYEDEPYITTETYYDSTIGRQRSREVTKYKQVKKQRQVTKYRWVTDWSTLSNACNVDTYTIVDNTKSAFLNHDILFKDVGDDLSGISKATSGKFADQMQVSDSASEEMKSKRGDIITNAVIEILPGDRYRDLDWNAQTRESTTKIYSAPTYKTTISFQGKTYDKCAFSVGKMNIYGDKIPNPNGLLSLTSPINRRCNEQSTRRNENAHSAIAKATNLFSFLTICLLLTSIIGSIAFSSVSLILTFLGISLVLSIACGLVVRKKESIELEKASADNGSLRRAAKEEIANVTKVYKGKQLEIVNAKLKALGYELATEDEILIGE